MMNRGRFITLEGGEGVGKTTNQRFIEAWLAEHSIPFISTREPGGTHLAEKIRSILLDKTQENMAEEAELLLMFASRAQHLQEKIFPALKAGIWVVCSRFTDSTYAYQGGGRGIPFSKIEALEQWVQGDFQPDLTFLLDLPVELGLQRARNRAELDRIEQESLDFFARVREGFLKRAKTHPRFEVIDASLSLEDIQSQIATSLSALVKINRT